MVTFLGGNYERYPDVIQRDAVWNYAALDPGVSPGNGVPVSWNKCDMPLTYKSTVQEAGSLLISNQTKCCVHEIRFRERTENPVRYIGYRPEFTKGERAKMCIMRLSDW